MPTTPAGPSLLSAEMVCPGGVSATTCRYIVTSCGNTTWNESLPPRITTSRPMSTTMPTASTHSSDRRLRTSARSASAPSTAMIGRP